jgi:ADP-heptose:LPS heptosyltransferase
MKILLAPWSRNLPNGNQNAKNYPLDDWLGLVDILEPAGYELIQIGRTSEQQICHDMRCDYTLQQIADLLREVHTFISVDSFLPHLANKIGKYGIVLFSRSDPQIFGYDKNINLYKDKRYFREDQFGIWDDCPYIKEAFVSPWEIYRALEEHKWQI